MNRRPAPDAWIVGILVLFTLLIAYLSSQQSEVCLDPASSPSLWTLLSWPLKVALLELAVTLGLLVFTLSRRLAAPIPYSLGEPRTHSEYVVSMAQLLRQARASSLVVDTLSTQFRRDLAQRLGLPPTAPRTELQRSLQAQNPALAERVRTLLDEEQRWVSLPGDRDVKPLIRWAREIASLRQQWRQNS